METFNDVQSPYHAIIVTSERSLSVRYYLKFLSIFYLTDLTRNAWQSPAVARQAHRTPHALHRPAKTPLTSDQIDVVSHRYRVQQV